MDMADIVLSNYVIWYKLNFFFFRLYIYVFDIQVF